MPTTRTRPDSVSTQDGPPAPEHLNQVHVVGRVAADPQEKILPSGDLLLIWRVIVERDGAPVEGRPHLDTLECVAWVAKLRRTVRSLEPGDIVEVTGSLRRRFWRSGPALNSRYEIEARSVKRVSRR